MLILALSALLLGLALLWWSGRSRRSLGIPSGRVIYADTRRWGPVEEPLYDPALGLTGRPDYLVRQRGRLIPVEVKSSRAPDEPYEGHIYQLAAYCLLVERVLGQRPPYGIIHYSNRTFAVDFTPDLEADTLDLLAEIRRRGRQRSVDRSHESPGRCEACGFRAICDQRMV